jgi:RHS repeat-associated protein
LNATNNALVRRYAWGLDLSGSLDGAGGVGGLLWMKVGPAPQFCAYDGNGNVVGMVRGSDGEQTAAYEYDPFGRTIRITGTLAQSNPFRFSTKRTDNTSDFVLYEYRLYNPSSGRWLSRDPVGGATVYAFLGNNSLSKIDVLGLTALSTIGKRLNDASFLTSPSDLVQTTHFPAALQRMKALLPRIKARYGKVGKGKEAWWLPDENTMVLDRNSSGIHSSTIIHEMTHAVQDLELHYSFDDANDRMDEGEAYAMQSFYGLAMELRVDEERMEASWCDPSVTEMRWKRLWRKYGVMPGNWGIVEWGEVRKS